MKTYLCPVVIVLPISVLNTLRCTLLAMFFVISYQSGFSQELVFKNARLETAPNTAGKDEAVYRFAGVTPNVDALVKIVKRSSPLVQLLDIDITSSGFDKAFQPQVTYNNGTTPTGKSDWYMEFEITFVKAATHAPVNVTKVDITTLDLDGNGNGLREYVTFFNQKTFTLESITSITAVSVLESLLGLLGLMPGKQFNGPTTNYANIDPTATKVMATNKYENVNKFRMRAGGKSDGRNEGADRMYSFWFKSFNFQAPVESALPVKLTSFSATKKNDTKIGLNWITAQEDNVSHFVVERSFNGADYTEVGMVFAVGNSKTNSNYNFTDELNSAASGIIYYRLRIVDMDGRIENSMVRLIRSGEQKETASIAAYPNPVMNELRVTLPATWQEKQVTIDIYNNNGQMVKRTVANKASQTETLNVSDMRTGLYVVKVSNGTEVAVQRIAKAK